MYLSHNIVQLIVDLEIAVFKLGQVKFSEENKEKFQIEKGTKSIASYAHAMGLPLTDKDAKKILMGQKLDTKDFRGPLIENYKIAQKLAESIADSEHIPFNNQIVLEINQNLAKGAVEDWRLRYREPNEQPSMVYDDLLDLLRNDPELTSVSAKIDQFLFDYNTNHSEQRFYKLSQLAYNLLRLQPFLSLNKFTLATLIDLLLRKMLGIELNSLVPLDFFQENKDKLLRIAELKQENAAEVLWHELFLGYLLAYYSDFVENILATSQQTNPKKTNPDRPFLDLNKRQLKILKYLQTIPTVKREDYVQMLDVSAMTAYRDLNQLLDYKLIKPIGTGRGTKYMLASR